MSGTAYEVGIHLSAVNNVSGVLAIIGREVFGLTGSVKRLEDSFKGLHRAFLGGIGVAAGVGMLHIMAGTVDKAKELSHELVQIQKLGITPVQYEQVRRQMEVIPRNVPGMTQVDAGKSYGAMYSIFGHDNALKMMEPLSKFAMAIGNTTGNFEGAFDKVYEMVRAGDLMGKFVNHDTHQVDTGKLSNFLDLGSRIQLATHGKVGPETWLGLAQQGGPAMAGMTDRGLGTMGIVAQAMGGQRGGTAISSLFQQLVGGITTQRVAEQMKDMGLITGYTAGKGGQVRIGADQKNPEYLALMKSDMLDFTKKLVEDMAKKGLNIDQMGDKLFELFGRQTTQRLMSDLIRNMPQIEGERTRMFGAMGIGQANDLANEKDLVQVEHNLKAAWDDFQKTLGNSQFVIDMLNKLTSAIRTMNTFAQDNPTAMKWLEGAAVVLAAALIAVGATAVVIAAAALVPGGGVALAVAGIAAAITALAALNWDAVAKGFQTVLDAIRNFAAGVGEAAARAAKGIQDAWKNGPNGAPIPNPNGGNGGTFNGAPSLDLAPKMNFSPPGKQSMLQPIHVHTAHNVDGHTWAQQTSIHMANLFEHPTSAPSQDRTRGFMSPDDNFATG